MVGRDHKISVYLVGILSVSLCTKKCISIKIDQFIQLFPQRGKSLLRF